MRPKPRQKTTAAPPVAPPSEPSTTPEPPSPPPPLLTAGSKAGSGEYMPYSSYVAAATADVAATPPAPAPTRQRSTASVEQSLRSLVTVPLQDLRNKPAPLLIRMGVDVKMKERHLNGEQMV